MKTLLPLVIGDTLIWSLEASDVSVDTVVVTGESLNPVVLAVMHCKSIGKMHSQRRSNRRCWKRWELDLGCSSEGSWHIAGALISFLIIDWGFPAGWWCSAWTACQLGRETVREVDVAGFIILILSATVWKTSAFESQFTCTLFGKKVSVNMARLINQHLDNLRNSEVAAVNKSSSFNRF